MVHSGVCDKGPARTPQLLGRPPGEVGFVWPDFAVGGGTLLVHVNVEYTALG